VLSAPLFRLARSRERRELRLGEVWAIERRAIKISFVAERLRERDARIARTPRVQDHVHSNT